MPTTRQSITTTASRRGYTATASSARQRCVLANDGGSDEDEKHDAAALGLARRLGWSGQWFRGALGDDGSRLVYVNAGGGDDVRNYSPLAAEQAIMDRAAFVVPDVTSRYVRERLALRRLRWWSEIQAAAKAAGSHFFDDSTMRFFSSTLGDCFPLRDGSALCVTGERMHGEPRAWTVRRVVYLVDPKACVVRLAIDDDEAGFQGYGSKAKAERSAKRRAELVNADPEAWAAMMKATGWPAASVVSPLDLVAKV